MRGSKNITDPTISSTIIEFQLRKGLGFNSYDFATMTQKEVMRQYECLKIQMIIDAENRPKG